MSMLKTPHEIALLASVQIWSQKRWRKLPGMYLQGRKPRFLIGLLKILFEAMVRSLHLRGIVWAHSPRSLPRSAYR